MKPLSVRIKMMKKFDAYLDIETTGLSPFYDQITVIGIYLHNGTEERFLQFYGENITIENLVTALENVHAIYTYNGRRFDLPFIRAFLGIDLENRYKHHDLMEWCHRHNLKGGFKAVEQMLGIFRETEGMSGYHAVILWERYQNLEDFDALQWLLKYNKEDVINLKILREILERRESANCE